MDVSGQSREFGAISPQAQEAINKSGKGHELQCKDLTVQITKLKNQVGNSGVISKLFHKLGISDSAKELQSLQKQYTFHESHAVSSKSTVSGTMSPTLSRQGLQALNTELSRIDKRLQQIPSELAENMPDALDSALGNTSESAIEKRNNLIEERSKLQEAKGEVQGHIRALEKQNRYESLKGNLEELTLLQAEHEPGSELFIEVEKRIQDMSAQLAELEGSSSVPQEERKIDNGSKLKGAQAAISEKISQIKEALIGAKTKIHEGLSELKDNIKTGVSSRGAASLRDFEALDSEVADTIRQNLDQMQQTGRELTTLAQNMKHPTTGKNPLHRLAGEIQIQGNSLRQAIDQLKRVDPEVDKLFLSADKQGVSPLEVAYKILNKATIEYVLDSTLDTSAIKEACSPAVLLRHFDPENWKVVCDQQKAEKQFTEFEVGQRIGRLFIRMAETRPEIFEDSNGNLSADIQELLKQDYVPKDIKYVIENRHLIASSQQDNENTLKNLRQELEKAKSEVALMTPAEAAKKAKKIETMIVEGQPTEFLKEIAGGKKALQGKTEQGLPKVQEAIRNVDVKFFQALFDPNSRYDNLIDFANADLVKDEEGRGLLGGLLNTLANTQDVTKQNDLLAMLKLMTAKVPQAEFLEGKENVQIQLKKLPEGLKQQVNEILSSAGERSITSIRQRFLAGTVLSLNKQLHKTYEAKAKEQHTSN